MTTVEKIATIAARLSDFGNDVETRSVLQRAIEQNAWFSEQAILDSLQAIVSDMLQPTYLEKWMSQYPMVIKEPKRVLVIMAGNIPAVGFADLLCVAISGHTALVKCSSKDTPIMEYIVGLFASYFDVRLYNGSESVDALVAMGSDSTAAALRAKYEGIPMLLRASRSSLAVLQGDESDLDLQALCRDITAYDGRGCRSVSLVMVPCGYDITTLMSILSQCDVSAKWLQVYRHTKALYRMSGTPFQDADNTIVAYSNEFPMNIATLHYAEYTSVAQVEEWLLQHDSQIQCVVGRVSHPRSVDFGQAQRPSLTDYPDGIDTMQFLFSI